MTDLSQEFMRDLIREQTQTLANIVRPSANTGGGGGGGISLSGAVPGMQTFNSAVGKASDGLSSLYKGTANLNGALNTFSSALSNVPGFGGALSKVTENIGEMALSTNAAQQNFQKYGAHFDQNITKMASQVNGAGMTLEEYNDILANHSKDLMGLGSTVNRTQNNFLSLGKDLRESGVIEELTKMGMSTDDINKLLVTSSYKKYNTDLSSAESQRKASLAAQDLAVSIEENSRLYGLSRDAQNKELQGRLDNIEVQAELMTMDEDAQHRYTEMNSKFAALGPAVGKLTDEIFTGGVRTKEGAELMAALGPAGSELEQAVMMQKEATTEQQKVEAKAAMERATARVLEYEKSREFAQNITMTSGSFKASAKSILEGNQEVVRAMSSRQAAAANKGEVLSAEQAQTSMRQEVRGQMQGLDQEGNVVDQNAVKMSQAINEANAIAKDQAAGLAKNVDSVVNSTKVLGESLDTLNSKLKRFTQEEAAESQKNLPSTIADSVKSMLPTATSTKSAKEMAEEIKPIERVNGSPSFSNFLSGGAGFDDMFEHFSPNGTPALLHGDELVANKDQMTKLFSKFDLSEQFKTLKDQTEKKKPESTDEKQLQPSADPIKKLTDMFEPVVNDFTPDKIKSIVGDVSSKFDAFAQTNQGSPDKIKSIVSDVTSKFDTLIQSDKGDEDKTKGFVDEITSSVSESFNFPEVSKMFYGIGDQFGDIYDSIAGDSSKEDKDATVTPKDEKASSMKEESTGFFDDLTSTISDTFNLPDVSKMLYGVGDQFSEMYDTITEKDEKVAKIDEIKPQLDTTKVTDQLKTTLGEVKKPDEGGISMANDALKDVKTTISSAKESQKSSSLPEKPSEPSPSEGMQPMVQTVTLNDVYDILVQLNSNIGRMATHTESLNNTSSKQVRETQKLSGSRFG